MTTVRQMRMIVITHHQRKISKLKNDENLCIKEFRVQIILLYSKMYYTHIIWNLNYKKNLNILK